MRIPPPPPRTHQEYDVISSADIDVIINAVNELTRTDGWRVHGNLVVTRSGYYLQTITRTVQTCKSND